MDNFPRQQNTRPSDVRQSYSRPQPQPIYDDAEYEESVKVSRRKTVKVSRINRVTIVMTIFFLAALGMAGYFYWKYEAVVKNPGSIAQNETQQLLNNVGQLINLPQDEVPTIATVSDPSLLKGQAFFANAQKGDKVLIYTESNKAIIYRPSTNKIVDVGPINVGSASQPTPTPTPSPTPTPTKTTKTTTSR